MRLREFIESVEVSALPIELPLVHTTQFNRIETIRTRGALIPQDCPVFGGKLLYFFYGRPAYKTKRSESSSSMLLCPICFVFRPGAIRDDDLERTYPFDSGAAQSGRFEKHIKPNTLDDYELGTALDAVRTLIQAVFATNEQYYDGEVNHPLPDVPRSSATRKYFDLVSDKSPAPYDDRRSAVERISNAKAELSQNLLAVVLPATFLRDENLKQQIREWGAKMVTYDILHGQCESQYCPVIWQRLRDFLAETFF